MENKYDFIASTIRDEPEIKWEPTAEEAERIGRAFAQFWYSTFGTEQSMYHSHLLHLYVHKDAWMRIVDAIPPATNR